MTKTFIKIGTKEEHMKMLWKKYGFLFKPNIYNRRVIAIAEIEAGRPVVSNMPRERGPLSVPDAQDMENMMNDTRTLGDIICPYCKKSVKMIRIGGAKTWVETRAGVFHRGCYKKALKYAKKYGIAKGAAPVE